MASYQGICLNCQQDYYQQSLLPLDYADFTFGGRKIPSIGCFVESQPKSTTIDGPKICLSCLEVLRTCHFANKRMVMSNDRLQKPSYVCATCHQLSPANNLMNIRLTVVNIDGRQLNLEQCLKTTIRADPHLMICLACLSVVVEEYGQLDFTVHKPVIGVDPELVEIKIEPGIMSEYSHHMVVVEFKQEPEEVMEPVEKHIKPESERSSPELFEPVPNDPPKRKQICKERRYCCAHCPRAFHYRSKFKAHVATHRSIDFKPNKFTCYYCPKKQFTHKQNVKEHLQKCHFPKESQETGKRPLKRQNRQHTCSVCSQKFYKHSRLAEHMEEHKELASLKCTVCLKTFQNMTQLIRHLRKQTGAFKCTKCEMGFHHETGIDKHMELVHNESYVCKICSLPLYTRRTFEIHQQVRHGIQTKARCKYCGQQFDTKGELNEHKTQHKEPPKKSFVCEQCGQAFRQEKEMKCHQETHTLVEKAQCHLCPKKFKNSTTLANHIQTIHLRKKARVAKTEYPCTMCPVRFERRQHLEGHMIVHNTENRPFFMCTKCGIAYTRRQKLQIHVTKCPKMDQEGFV